MSNYQDLTGQVFGKLTVLEDAGRYSKGTVKWKCKCECGSIRFTKGSYLKNGEIKSCKECVHEDMTGKSFGNVTVTCRSEDRIISGNKVIIWKCKCKCGKVIYRRSHSLKSYNCSCAKCKNTIDKNKNYKGYEGISGTYWSSLKNSATLRGIKFDIDIKYAWELYEKQDKKCAVSGLEIVFASSRKDYLSKKTTASLDRIDSKKHYSNNNIQWIHKTLNKMKSNQPQKDFVFMCSAVCDYQRQHDKQIQATN